MHGAGFVHQGFGLEALHVGEREPVVCRIEQAAERAVQRVGHQARI